MPEFRTFGSCVPQERISSGPISDLYLAAQLPLDRQVWVRCLRDDISPSSDLANALRREAQVLARLSHPCIQSLFEFVDTKTDLWLVLEAVDAIELGELLDLSTQKQDLALRVSGSIAIALQIANGLAHLHSRGFIHSALRPEHVLISRTGLVKLTGLALAQDSNSSHSEAQDFDSGFEASDTLSPEQLLGEPPDPRSDVYALGLLLQRMITSKPSQDSEVPPLLERIIHRCLQQAPAERFSSAKAVGNELARLLSPESSNHPEAEVVRALQDSGFHTAVDTASCGTSIDEEKRTQQIRSKLRVAIRGLLFTCLLFSTGGAVLFGWHDTQEPATLANRSAQRATSEKSLLNATLLVVARPWAHVFIDGEHRETTPFSHPLRLSSGVHHIRLEHPSAPAERRTLTFAEGEQLVLSVELPVPMSPAAQQLSTAPDAGRPAASQLLQ